MTVERGVHSSTAPALVVRAQGSDRTLRAGPSYRVGRDPQSDIVVDEPRVSWRHAILRLEHDRWLLEDVGSTNGTFVGLQRVQRVDITGTCQVRLGHPGSGPLVSCSVAAAPENPATAVVPAAAVLPGQQPASGAPPAPGPPPGPDGPRQPWPDAPQQAWRDGPSAPAQRSIGERPPSAIMRLPARVLRIGRADDNDVVVSDLSVSRHHAELRKAPQGRYEIVDLGSHKVTYLNGQRITAASPLTESDVIGVGLAAFRLIGDELQEFIDTGDISLNAQGLTVRLPGGKVLLDNVSFPLGERCLLGVIGPSGAGKTTLLGALTGMSPATQGSVLYEDRDLYTGHAGAFGLDMSVMEMMSGLARDGRTVIVVTHSVANLNVCDRLLVLVPGGKVAYFGPQADGLRHFGKPGWAQVFQAFETEPDRDWAGEYRRSAFCAQYVTAAGQADRSAAAAVRAVPPPPRPRNRLAQLSTLTRRYLSVIASDRNYVAVLALLPVILGGLIRLVPDPAGLTGPNNGNAQQVLLILVMGACLTGVANAVRELVKERAIYTRERAAGLSAGAYLWSKLVVLGLISALQAVFLVVIGLVGRPLPPQGAFLTSFPLIELMLAIAVLAVASMTLGLLISAIVNSSDKTMPLLVVVVLVEVVLSGGVFPVNGKAGLDQLSWFSASRWGFGATASTSSLNKISPPLTPGTKPDPLWNHSPHIWLLDMAMQLVLTAVFVWLTLRKLNRVGPGHRR